MSDALVETQKKITAEKEMELAKNINNTNEDNWTKIIELTNEK